MRIYFYYLITYCHFRRRIPKEVPPGVGQAEYMGMDDYGDEDEVALYFVVLQAIVFYFVLFCSSYYCVYSMELSAGFCSTTNESIKIYFYSAW